MTAFYNGIGMEEYLAQEVSKGWTGLWLLKKADTPKKTEIPTPHSTDASSTRRIRCPLCEWQPDVSSIWVCYSGDGPEPPFPACGTAWNTFATRGKCPGCAHQWRWTSCLGCGGWSPHDEWYEDLP